MTAGSLTSALRSLGYSDQQLARMEALIGRMVEASRAVKAIERLTVKTRRGAPVVFRGSPFYNPQRGDDGK